MQDLQNSLNQMGQAINNLANQPVEIPTPADRSISGNKINGGLISNFRSVGIKDTSTNIEVPTLLVENEKITVKSIDTQAITNDLTVDGSLHVGGEITATRLNVNEINADVRNERTSPLEFQGPNGGVGKGLIWTGGAYTKQFIMQNDRLFSSENIDLAPDKEYKINNLSVLGANSLGDSVVASNLQTVGVLQNLTTVGSLNIDGSVFWDANSERLGLFTDAPNGLFAVNNFDHEFVIDASDTQFKVGTWSNTGLKIITDDTDRIVIEPNGKVTVKSKMVVETALGVGVKNFAEDASITTAGPVRFQNKKFEVGDDIPSSGSYSKGDIVWNSNPTSSGYVGWICIREGTPGDWKRFGQIA